MSDDTADAEDILEDLEAVRQDQDQILHLNYRGLCHLPHKLLSHASDFDRVTRIYMKRNLLTSLPEDIWRLSNLVELYVPGNNISDLPDGLGRLNKLESLDVSDNCLTSFPRSICRLQELERLNLSNNALTFLPREIGQLKNLKVLEIINNKLHHLPLEISYCTSLNRLLLDRNQLVWLPRQLCRLRSLEELSASGNLLLYLPLELGNMDSLKCVYVDNNPYLHAVPVSLFSQELGFNSSGIENFSSADLNTQWCYLDIEQSEAEWKRIYLPREILAYGGKDRACVPALLELAMRAVYTHLGDDINLSEVPRGTWDLINAPVSLCYCCQRPMFTMGYPMVFEGQIRLFRLYRLAMCCSQSCVKVASLAINLPLIYPNPSTLHMAVALVED